MSSEVSVLSEENMSRLQKDGASAIPRSCQRCGLFGRCQEWLSDPYKPKDEYKDVGSMNKPDRIYLQWYGDDPAFGAEDGDPPIGTEITWCQDRINDSDLEFVSVETLNQLLSVSPLTIDEILELQEAPKGHIATPAEDALHIAICNAVTALGQGENYKASSILREALANYLAETLDDGIDPGQAEQDGSESHSLLSKGEKPQGTDREPHQEKDRRSDED